MGISPQAQARKDQVKLTPAREEALRKGGALAREASADDVAGEAPEATDEPEPESGDPEVTDEPE